MPELGTILMYMNHTKKTSKIQNKQERFSRDARLLDAQYHEKIKLMIENEKQRQLILNSIFINQYHTINKYFSTINNYIITDRGEIIVNDPQNITHSVLQES